MAQGQQALEEQRPADALTHAQAALALDSRCREGHLLAAAIYEAQGQWADALDEVERALLLQDDAALEVRRYELLKKAEPARRPAPRAAVAIGAAALLLLLTTGGVIIARAGTRDGLDSALQPAPLQQPAPAAEPAIVGPPAPAELAQAGNAPGPPVAAAGPAYPAESTQPSASSPGGGGSPSAVRSRIGLPLIINRPPERRLLEPAAVGQVTPLTPRQPAAVEPGGSGWPQDAAAAAAAQIAQPPPPRRRVELLEPESGFIRIEPLPAGQNSPPSGADASQQGSRGDGRRASELIQLAHVAMQRGEACYNRRLLEPAQAHFEHAMALLQSAQSVGDERTVSAARQAQGACRQAILTVVAARRAGSTGSGGR